MESQQQKIFDQIEYRHSTCLGDVKAPKQVFENWIFLFLMTSPFSISQNIKISFDHVHVQHVCVDVTFMQKCHKLKFE